MSARGLCEYKLFSDELFTWMWVCALLSIPGFFLLHVDFVFRPCVTKLFYDMASPGTGSASMLVCYSEAERKETG